MPLISIIGIWSFFLDNNKKTNSVQFPRVETLFFNILSLRSLFCLLRWAQKLQERVTQKALAFYFVFIDWLTRSLKLETIPAGTLFGRIGHTFKQGCLPILKTPLPSSNLTRGFIIIFWLLSFTPVELFCCLPFWSFLSMWLFLSWKCCS